MSKLTQKKLDEIVKHTVARRYIKGAVFHVSDGNSLSFTSAAGNMQTDSRYYIASINKFFISAITLRLCNENKISLEDQIANYLPEEMLKGLHVYRGKEYSQAITISHLISNTSGLPCYLIDKRANRAKIMEELLHGKDQEWSTEAVIREVKTMKTKFPPGQKGKANYSNTNFRLMSKVLEAVMGKSITSILNGVFAELEMHQTYVFQNGENPNFLPVYSKEKAVELPHYFASSQFDIISTAPDQMIFLKAFFDGYFYPKEKLKELEKWNRIFFPFQYGVGIQQFHTPRILSPFKPIPDFIGHCGSVGTAAFYIPAKQIYITGTINQAKNPRVLFQAMIKIIS